MNYYPHHIGDFNNATRNLTWTQKMAYRELIEFYYDKESPIPNNMDHVQFRLGASTEEQKNAITLVLNYFFTLTADGEYWTHTRCDEEIAHYQSKRLNQSKAGKASAAKRSKAQQTLNKRQPTSNQEPTTSNHFIKPSLEDCIDHIAGKVTNSTQVGQAFYDHYEAAGWMIKGGVKMKKWRSALNGWVTRGRQYEEDKRIRNGSKSDKNDQALRELYN